MAMSGGVDSSVAALMMKKAGYEVVGAFMKNWSDTKNSFGECAWRDDRKMALKVASMLGIPLITLDFEKQYKSQVVNEMFKSYKQGIVPNPDVDCNQKIKFPLLWKAAKKIGADFIVTGHYARIKKIKAIKSANEKTTRGSAINNVLRAGGRDSNNLHYNYELLRAKDETKDQSYFLYRLSEEDLSHTLFPIGNYTKKQIRKIAEENHFPNFDRKGTVGICFIGKVNLKDFLQKKIKPKPGKILEPSGNIIGKHDGIYYYTIGQRIGPRFGINIEKIDDNGNGKIKRWYVAKKDLKTNTITAAPEGNPLNFRKEMTLKDVHWINEAPSLNKIYYVKSRIRQVGELLPSKLRYNKTKKRYCITLAKSITGIAEGQAAVLYQGENVLGGGVISFN